MADVVLLSVASTFLSYMLSVCGPNHDPPTTTQIFLLSFITFWDTLSIGSVTMATPKYPMSMDKMDKMDIMQSYFFPQGIIPMASQLIG